MTDLKAAIAALPVDPFYNADPALAETADDVFTPKGDTYQRFNSTWREGLRRESDDQESSP